MVFFEPTQRIMIDYGEILLKFHYADKCNIQIPMKSTKNYSQLINSYFLYEYLIINKKKKNATDAKKNTMIELSVNKHCYK